MLLVKLLRIVDNMHIDIFMPLWCLMPKYIHIREISSKLTIKLNI